MGQWSAYQTQHLILLVGSNPLPNYVAGLLLAQQGARVALLHSEATAQVADRLRAGLLRRRDDLRISLYQSDETEGSRIAREVDGILRGVPPDAFVGLNYTGGTKAMAVHAYGAVQRAFPSAVFSYLRASDVSMLVHAHGSAIQVLPVGDDCQVPLKELLNLHNWPIAEIRREPILPGVRAKLMALSEDAVAEWRAWCNQARRDAQGKEKRKADELKDTLLPQSARLRDVFSSLPPIENLGAFAALQGGSVHEAAKWLEGPWLEHEVLQRILDLAGECHIHDCGMGIKSTRGRTNFEFDVAAMRGYQLFALSCTTSADKGLSKSKLLEIYVRARQVGGDEARVGLICCYDKPEELQQEIAESWFTEGRVSVFGRRHLPDLTAYLREWFMMTDGH
ncbi:MAG: hypothetical protein GXY76_14195 [Chloroflexi bacterium]|nr:hypothetical protein [Chloroflexota bacterium]